MTTLRLLSANLLNGGADPDAVAAALRDLRIDVACFQELAPEQADAIAAVLPFGKLEPETNHDGMGIALARPASLEHLPLPRRPGRIARLSPGDWEMLGEPLEILGLHIQAPHSGGPWTAFSLRRRQLRGVLAHLARTPGAARIVCGDLNATPAWPLYRALAAQLDDAAIVAAGTNGERPRPTWGPWPAGPRLLRIDHALCQGLGALRARPVRLPGTDHSALFVELAPRRPAQS